MKKLNLAIIGQGRSGKNIHGAFYVSENNKYFNVKYVVDADARRREKAEKMYPGCIALADYQSLFDKEDIDLVVNASFSQMHYSITKDLLMHKFNVLTEKPLASTKAECEDLIKTAEENNVHLVPFQQSFFAPHYTNTKKIIEQGCLRAASKSLLTFCSESPNHLEAISEHLTEKNAASSSVAIAWANIVFPVPGTPYRRMPPPFLFLNFS